MDNQDRGAPSLFTITLVQILVLALLFVALLNGQRELIVLTLLLLGIIGGARLWSRVSSASLHCQLTVDRYRVFPDEKISLRLNVENAKLLPIWLEARIPVDAQILSKANSLLWYEKTRFEWEWVAPRRGVYSIGTLHLRTGDLFSFFTRQSQLAQAHSLIVYPRLVPLKSFSLPRRDFFGIPRAHNSVQDPIYILGTRDYQPGQPSKFIHWKASAHRHRLQEKVFESTVQEKILLVVDAEGFASQEADEEWEHTLSVVASLAVRLNREGHSVGMVTNAAIKGNGSARVPIARNEQQSAAILGVLAALEMKSARAMKHILRQATADAWGITCVYFAYADDEHCQFADSYFRQHHMPALIVVNEKSNKFRRNLYRLDELLASQVVDR